jgi:hypothetical protein
VWGLWGIKLKDAIWNLRCPKNYHLALFMDRALKKNLNLMGQIIIITNQKKP